MLPQEAPTTIRPGWGTPCRRLPPHRDGDPPQKEISKPWGGEKGGCNVEVGIGQESRYQSVSKKGGREVIVVFGEGVDPEAILGCEKSLAMAPEIAPRGPRRTPRNPARPR